MRIFKRKEKQKEEYLNYSSLKYGLFLLMSRADLPDRNGCLILCFAEGRPSPTVVRGWDRDLDAPYYRCRRNYGSFREFDKFKMLNPLSDPFILTREG